jgi:signal peptidase I
MAGDRGGRDDGHGFQTHPPHYGRSGWEPEADGYPGTGYPAEHRAPGGYRPGEPGPGPDPWPGEQYPPDPPYRPGGYSTGEFYPTRDTYPPPDPYRRDGSYPQSRDDYGYVPRDSAARRGARKRKGLPLWQELPLLLVIAFCLAVLVRTFLLQAFYIPSGSMEDTLVAGDRVLVNKVVYNFREPARGEIVVFQGTDAWAPVGTGDADIGMFAKVGRTLGDLVGISRPGEKDFIKRVVGLPGDIVSCCDVDGRVFVNGQPLDESYVIRNSPLDDGPAGEAQDCRTRRFNEVVVQPGQIFVMGDHRQVSQDSRCQGQVPIDNVIGRAFLIVWPSSRWSSLPAPGTFDTVPQPVAVGGAPAPPEAPAQLAFVLPVLLPVGWTLLGSLGHSRLIGRKTGRRLAG